MDTVKNFNLEVQSLYKILKERNKNSIEMSFYIFAFYYYNKFRPPAFIVEDILEKWEGYSRRRDIKLDGNHMPKQEVLAFSNMNKAFRIPITNKQKMYENFINPVIDHNLYINDDLDIQQDIFFTTSPDHKHIIEFMIEKNNATRSEIAFSILSHCYENDISIPPDILKIIADGWCRYSQSSDLANQNRFIPVKKTDIVRTKTMNEAFDIPIYTNGRVRKEFYSKLVYMSLASLRAQGVTINNEAHDFVGHKYGFSGGTSKNYYSYLLAKGAPSLSGRRKVTNTRTYFNIPFFPMPEDLAAFKNFKRKEELRRKNQSGLLAD